jgi:hypothetical protein
MSGNQALAVTLLHPKAAAVVRREAFFNSILKSLDIEWVWQYVVENNIGRDNTYHNNLHMMTIAVNCWEFFYVECPDKANDDECSLAQLIVAACLHDMNHSGGEFDDEENIRRACEAVDKIEGSLDKQFYHGFGRKVEGLIRITQYPFVYIPKTRLQKILRDCDAMQAYEPDGVEVILEGLRMEMRGRLGYVPTRVEMYEGQLKFMANIEYYTETAKSIITAFDDRLRRAFQAYVEATEGAQKVDEATS